MAFMRTDTAHTLKSRAWSTEDLSVGLAHILTDGRLELPDDLSQLKEIEQTIADLEASQAADRAKQELLTVATPQASKSGAGIQDADTLPATDSQLEESKASSKAPSSPVNSIGSMASSARTPSDTSVAAQQQLILMYQKGQVDAATAMQLLADMSSTPKSETSQVPPKGDSRKRGRSPESESDKDTDGDEDMDTQPGNILDIKTKNNLKAKLRRLCELKKGNKLNVPQWLHDAWKSGDHLSMALEYQKAGFDKEQFIKVCEKTTTEIERQSNKVAVGWYSKEDMRTDLKWNTKKIEGAILVCMQDEKHLVRNCKYGGEPEYWVETRETGEKGNEKEEKKKRTEMSEDKSKDPVGNVDTSKIKQMEERRKASESLACAKSSEVIRCKTTLSKYCDSLLSKSAKIRSLVNDLQKHYDDPLATKSVKALEADLVTLEKRYNLCSEHLAMGETEDFNQAWSLRSEKMMKESTFECTKVGLNESKIRNAKRHFKKKEKEAEG